MSIISSTPQSLTEVFSKIYEIPEFQREYSWGKEECQKLFDDLLEAFESNEFEYFLGNIVVYPDEKNKNILCVIDGQQRLTTLSILFKVIWDKNRIYTTFKEWLFQKDPLNGEVDTNLPRLKTNVIDDDKISFEKIIKNGVKDFNDKDDKKNNFFTNYKTLETSYNNSILLQKGDNCKRFLEFLTKTPKILPIQCDNQENALIIFQTLNNRGLPLGDMDIFKAKLYNQVKNDAETQKEFIEKWKEITKWQDKFKVPVFALYMHIIRAEFRDTSSLKAVRKFFENNEGKDKLANYTNVLNDLTKIMQSIEFIFNDSKNSNLANFLYHKYPNEYPLYPIAIFLFKHCEIKENKKVNLSYEKEKELEILLKTLIAYLYTEGNSGLGAIKYDIYKLSTSIFHEEHADLSIIKNKIIYDRVNYFNEIENSRYKNGIVILHALLKQTKKIEYWDKVEIEHILPQNGFNNYDGWTEDQYKEYLNKLGNLMPLEKALNISASNEFFAKKCAVYNGLIYGTTDLDPDKKATVFTEALNVAKNNTEWKPKNVDERDKEVKDNIIAFFNKMSIIKTGD